MLCAKMAGQLSASSGTTTGSADPHPAVAVSASESEAIQYQLCGSRVLIGTGVCNPRAHVTGELFGAVCHCGCNASEQGVNVQDQYSVVRGCSGSERKDSRS